MDASLLSLSSAVGKTLIDHALTISTAESCTGGLLSYALTATPGSSAYFTGGVVAYSNAIKTQVLGVHAMTLEEFGAVSVQTAREMAEGVQKRFQTDIGLSTTGIAGPTGATFNKPVGLVCVGISIPEKTWAYECRFSGERLEIMQKSVCEVLNRLLVELGAIE